MTAQQARLHDGPWQRRLSGPGAALLGLVGWLSALDVLGRVGPPIDALTELSRPGAPRVVANYLTQFAHFDDGHYLSPVNLVEAATAVVVGPAWLTVGQARR